MEFRIGKVLVIMLVQCLFCHGRVDENILVAHRIPEIKLHFDVLLDAGCVLDTHGGKWPD